MTVKEYGTKMTSSDLAIENRERLIDILMDDRRRLKKLGFRMRDEAHKLHKEKQKNWEFTFNHSEELQRYFSERGLVLPSDEILYALLEFFVYSQTLEETFNELETKI